MGEATYTDLEDFLKRNGPEVKLSVYFTAHNPPQCVIDVQRKSDKYRIGMAIDRVSTDSLATSLLTLNIAAREGAKYWPLV